jgi:predicted acylesterase/phospholipase RssA
VCTVRGENSETAFLRTYENPVTADALSKDFKVWEACRATSAATTFFEPYVHAEYGQKFIDGGLQYNNPVVLVLQEAKDMWPDDEVMLISVGTGNAPGQKFGGNLATIAKGLKAIATETEKTAKMFHRSHQNMVQDNRYFRFNVPGMASIGLQEHKEIPSIASASQTYLEDSETGQKLGYCTIKIVESLKEGTQLITSGPSSRSLLEASPTRLVEAQEFPWRSEMTPAL